MRVPPHEGYYQSPTGQVVEHPDLLAVDDAVGSSHGNREFRENLAPAGVDAFEPPLDPGCARLFGDQPLQVSTQATDLILVELHRLLDMLLQMAFLALAEVPVTRCHESREVQQ